MIAMLAPIYDAIFPSIGRCPCMTYFLEGNLALALAHKAGTSDAVHDLRAFVALALYVLEASRLDIRMKELADALAAIMRGNHAII